MYVCMYVYNCEFFIVMFNFQTEECINKIFCTLRGHSGNVNCVRWASWEGASEPFLLVSGGVDGHVIVWKQQKSKFSVSLRFSVLVQIFNNSNTGVLLGGPAGALAT